jgi:alpha-tubulin suppressor-like RCC1 family protein
VLIGPSSRGRVRTLAVVCVWALGCLLAAGAGAEQASEPGLAAGWLDAGGAHTCAVLSAGSVRCWGYGGDGELGLGSTADVGVSDTPALVPAVNLDGHTARAVATGDDHTCAILDDGSVRCWGFGDDGRLGYGNTNQVLDPGLVGSVNLGAGRMATAITAGSAHTCAILDDGSVRCWGFGGAGHQLGDGRLGYGNTSNVGDTPASTPATAGPVNVGAGRTAVAITAGGAHTCAILDDGSVRCWGYNRYGQLGYGNTIDIGGVYADFSQGTILTTTPDMAGPVNLGAGHKAIAISAGTDHTCAILDDDTVRCWGDGAYGALGDGTTTNLADTPSTTPDRVGAVNLGLGRTAIAISAGGHYTCAILDDHSVRCWGQGTLGRLGYPTLDSLGNQASILDPSATVPVDLGPGRTAIAISAGIDHTCARLDDGTVRCWGNGANGELGYCNAASVGETNTPGSVGPVNLTPGDGGQTCPGTGTTPGPSAGGSPPSATPSTPATPPPAPGALATAARAAALRSCLAKAGHAPKRRRALARKRCLTRFGRTPGAITGLIAASAGGTAINLLFNAAGTNGNQAPPAVGYLIKQSTRPIRTPRDFRRASALCAGDCAFTLTSVGQPVTLTVTGLRPHTTYYYALLARDNVSNRCGPRSITVKATTGQPQPPPPSPPDTGSGGTGQSAPPLPNHHAPPCQTLG